jgi:hypothetical protein
MANVGMNLPGATGDGLLLAHELPAARMRMPNNHWNFVPFKLAFSFPSLEFGLLIRPFPQPIFLAALGNSSSRGRIGENITNLHRCIKVARKVS